MVLMAFTSLECLYGNVSSMEDAVYVLMCYRLSNEGRLRTSTDDFSCSTGEMSRTTLE